MQIRFTKAVTLTADKGQVITLPDFQAHALVELGVAEVVIDLGEVIETATLEDVDMLMRHDTMKDVQ
jgi:hypothetical protein